MPALTARTLARPSFEAAFEAPAFLRAMLDFEAALARAQAAEGLIPAASAAAIARACAALELDEDAVVAEAKRSATLVVPLARLLKQAVAREAPGAEAHAHFGATTQDVLDTAMALKLRDCLAEADRTLEAAVRALAARAREHRATPMLGRTLLQPALPVTAGLKIARWAAALHADRARLAQARGSLAVQLGGPVGALESHGDRGEAVRRRVARDLGLADAPCWHVHRNDWLDALGRVAQVVATAGKIALDLSLLAQPEVGEMREGAPQAGVGASSAMPHKRNPVGCVHALAAAARAPGLLATLHSCALAAHERAAGGWQAELATVPALAAALGESLDFLDTISRGLVVDAQRMGENLERHGAGLPVPLEALAAATDGILATLPGPTE